MSSIDLHMHSGFQRILPESFAVVCAPNSTPKCVFYYLSNSLLIIRLTSYSFGIFQLTDPLGLQMIIECQATDAHHLHPESIYTVRIPGFFDMMKRYGMMNF